MLSEDETENLLLETNQPAGVGSGGGKDSSSKDVKILAEIQDKRTSSLVKKIWEFVRIGMLRRPNEFEEYVCDIEPNDCSLVSKYFRVTEIDLLGEESLTVESVLLNTVKIPHPLVNFSKNEVGQLPNSDKIRRELEESPVLVFLHGLGGQMSQFEPLMGLMSQCLEILAVDLPGFGNSKLAFDVKKRTISDISDPDKARISQSIANMSAGDFSTANIVRIIVRFIEQEVAPEKKIILIGHSMGTHLSVKVARSLPKHKVEGLVLLSPPAFADDVTRHDIQQTSKTLSILSVFNYLPWLFNLFRVWDRLEGLSSKSVLRQLSKLSSSNNSSGDGAEALDPSENIYNRLRQFRWNLDVDSTVILNYISGFQKAKYSEVIEAISKFNDNPFDRKTYRKTLLIAGSSDQVTSVSVIDKTNQFLNAHFGREVSAATQINHAGHSLLLAKPEFISGIILNHFELKFPERLHLSPAWVLKVKADISGDKWGLKNEAKWQKLKPLSSNIVRNNGNDIAPLLGMKTLREGDSTHSPVLLEKLFTDKSVVSQDKPKGNLIAIVDISADIPPYSPKSFHYITYYKCATVSKVVPDQIAVRRFIRLIDDILSSNTTENPLIAVHCHYGFNRTGYLICCYLIEKLGWSVHEAIEGFKTAKFPGIKHPHFIDALYVRYED